MSRLLTPKEKDLAVAILGSRATLLSAAPLVEEMSDGRMGSLRFVGAPGRRFGSCAGEVTFKDADGIPVSASVNLDQDGRLFELDIWKADFSRLPADCDILRNPNYSLRHTHFEIEASQVFCEGTTDVGTVAVGSSCLRTSGSTIN